MKQIYLLIAMLIVSCSGKPRSTESTAPIPANVDKHVVCFVYHRFGDTRYPATNISVKDFEAHLAHLVENNFQVLSFSGAIAYLRSAEPARKTAVITIDDGYKSFFNNSLPLLKKYALPATLFINTKTVGGGDYMNWEELAEVAKSNIEIGNHTHSHHYFLKESVSSRYNTFRQEVELSQTTISERLHIVPQVFSYPYGEFDTQMKNIVRNAGFVAAVGQNSGVIYPGTDLFMCPRFPMSEAHSSPAKFVEKASMRALKVLTISPDNFDMPDDKKPLLTLVIDNTDLLLRQLQCFVQNGECEFHIRENSNKQTTITIQATKAISGRRRTLYTVTVPDKNGTWHWYSHLWINNQID